jgi:apolipoprotein N-acyltransferase
MPVRLLSLAGQRGWPRYGLAALSGAIGALALAPIDCAPALIITMSCAVWMLDACASEPDQGLNSQIRAAVLIGWWQGFGYFTAGLWWLGHAFLVDADQFAWALPLGVFGLPAVLAVFNGCGFGLARWLWTAHPVRIVTLAAALALSELLRGVVMTGFPWNAYGMALSAVLPLAQTAALVGLPGLTLIAAGVAAAPATLLDRAPRGQRLVAPVLALALLACMGIGGIIRLEQPAVMRDHVLLRVVQPIIPQDDKFSMANARSIMQTYIDLTLGDKHAASDPMDGVTHVIWPESAFPFILAREPAALQMIADMLKHKAILITGAIREERRISETPQGPQGQRQYYNSAQVVGADGSILASADKVHLVPFGEYLPLSDLLSQWGLRRFVTAPGSFSTGEALRLLDLPGLAGVTFLICYEAIFPAAVTPHDQRPSVLVNLTSDAWFGFSPGPHQHFAQARLRTIEEGLPMVRSANAGISAVIDPFGRILTSVPLGQENALTSALPRALPPTLFARSGFAPAILLILSGLLASLWTRRKLLPQTH